MAEMIKFRVGIGAQLNAKDIESQLKAQKSDVIKQVRKSLEKGEKPKIDFGFDIDNNSGISDADAKKFKSQCEKQINNLIDSIMKSFGDQMTSSITNELTRNIEDLFDNLGETMINSFESMKKDVIGSLNGKPIQINTSDMIDVKSDKGKMATQVKKVISDNVKSINDDANKAYKKLFDRSIKFDGKSFTQKYVEKLRGDEKDLDKISKNFFSTVEKVAQAYKEAKAQQDALADKSALVVDPDDPEDSDYFKKLYDRVKKSGKKLKSEMSNIVDDFGDIEDIDNIIKKASKANSFDEFIKLANSASEEFAISNEKINQQVADLEEILARLEYAYRKKWIPENEMKSIFDMKKYFGIDTSELRSASEKTINKLLDENDRISVKLQESVKSGELFNAETDLMNFDIRTLKKNILSAIKEIRKNIKPIELPFTPESESLGNFTETVLNKIHDVFDESIPVKAKLINEDELREQLNGISGLNIDVNANVNGVTQSDNTSIPTLPPSNQGGGIRRVSEDVVLAGIPQEDIMNAINDGMDEYYDSIAKSNVQFDETVENIYQMTNGADTVAESFTHIETKAKEVKKTASEIADILLKNAGVENISNINQPLEDAKEELEILQNVHDLRRKTSKIRATKLNEPKEELEQRRKMVEQWHELSEVIESVVNANKEYQLIQEKLMRQQKYEDRINKGLHLQPDEQREYDGLKIQKLEEAFSAQEKVLESAKQELDIRKQTYDLFRKYSSNALISAYQKINNKDLNDKAVIKQAEISLQALSAGTMNYSTQDIIEKGKNNYDNLTTYEKSYVESIKISNNALINQLHSLDSNEKKWKQINELVSKHGVTGAVSYLENKTNDLDKALSRVNNRIAAKRLSGADYTEDEGLRNTLQNQKVKNKYYLTELNELINNSSSEENVKQQIVLFEKEAISAKESFQQLISITNGKNQILDDLRHKDIKSHKEYLDQKESLERLSVANSSYQKQIEEKTLEYSKKSLDELKKQAKKIASEKKDSKKATKQVQNMNTKQELASYIASNEVYSGSEDASNIRASLERKKKQIQNYETDMNEIIMLINKIVEDPTGKNVTGYKMSLETLIQRAGVSEIDIEGFKKYQNWLAKQKGKNSNNINTPQIDIKDYEKGTSSIQEVIDNLDKDIKAIEDKNAKLNSSLSQMSEISTKIRDKIVQKVDAEVKTLDDDIANLKNEILEINDKIKNTNDPLEEQILRENKGKLSARLTHKERLKNEYDREREIDRIYEKDNKQLAKNISKAKTELYINNQKLEQLKLIREEQEKLRREKEPTVKDIEEQKNQSTKDYSLQKNFLKNQLTSMQSDFSTMEEELSVITTNVENNILELKKKKEEQQKIVNELISSRNTDEIVVSKFIPDVENIESVYLEEYHKYLSSTADSINTENINRQRTIDNQKEINNLISKYNAQDEKTLKIEIKKQIAVAKLLDLYDKIEAEQKSVFKDNNLLTSYISEMENIASELGIEPGKATKFGQSYNYNFRKGYKSTLTAMHSGSLSKMSVNELEILLSTIDNLTSEKQSIVTKADVLGDTYHRVVNELSYQLSNINNELLDLDEKINDNKNKITESLKKSLLESSQKNSDFISKNLGDTDEAKQNLVMMLNLVNKLYEVTNKNGRKSANTTKFLNSIGISKDILKQAQNLISIGVTGSNAGFEEEKNLENLEKQRKSLKAQKISIESELTERNELLAQQQVGAQILKNDLEKIRQKYVDILKAKLEEQKIKLNSTNIEEQNQALVNTLELTKELKSITGIKSSSSILFELGIEESTIKRAEGLISEQNAAERNRARNQKNYDVKKDAEISKQQAIVDAIEKQINDEKDKLTIGQKQIQAQKELVDAKQAEIDALEKSHKAELKSFNDKKKAINDANQSHAIPQEISEVTAEIQKQEQAVEELADSKKKLNIHDLTGEQKASIGKVLNDIDASKSSTYVSESDDITKELVRLNEEFDGQLVQLIRDKCQSVLEYIKKSTNRDERATNKQWIDKMRQSIIPIIEATLAYQGLSPELQQKVNEKDNDLDTVIQTWILSKLNGVLESETLFNKGKNVTGIQIGGKDFSKASADKYDTWFQTHTDGMGIFSPSDFSRLESDWKKGLRKFQLLVDGSLHEIDFSGIKKAPKTLALQFVKEYEAEYKELTKGLNTVEDVITAKNQAFTNVINRETFSEIKYTIQENYIDTMKKAGEIAEQVSEDIVKSNKKIKTTVKKTTSVVNNTPPSSPTPPSAPPSASNVPTDINIIGISNTSGLATEAMQEAILGAINGTIKVTGDVNITGGNINIGDNNNIRMDNSTSPINNSANLVSQNNVPLVESTPIDINSQHNADLLNDAVRETMKKVTVPSIDSEIVIDEEKSRLALQSASEDIIKDMQSKKGHITKVEFLTDNIWEGESIVNSTGKVIEEKITGYQKLTNAIVTYKNAANETIRSMYTLQKVFLPKFDEKGNPVWKKDNKGKELVGQQDFTIAEIFAQDNEKLLKQGDSANKVIERRTSLIGKYDRTLDTIASRAKDKAISKPLSDDSLTVIDDIIEKIRSEIAELNSFDNINQINEQIIKIEKSINNLRNRERELRNQDNVTSFRSRSDIDSYNIAQSKIMGIEAEVSATGISSKKLTESLTKAKEIMGETFGNQTASNIQKVDDLIASMNAEIQALKKVKKQKDIEKSNIKETYNEIMSLIQIIIKAEDTIDNLNAQKIKNPLLVNDSELEKQAQIISDAYRKLNSLDHNAFMYKSKKSKYISQKEYDAYTLAYSQRGGTLDKSSDAKKTMANKEAIQREKIANSILNEEIKTVERLSNLHAEMQIRISQGKDIEVIKEKIALEQKYLKQLKEEMLYYSDTEAARSSYGKLKDTGKKSGLKVKQAYVDANLAKTALEEKENNNARRKEYQAILGDYELGWKQFYKIQGEMRKANPNSFIYEQMEMELDQLFQKQIQLYNKAVSFDDIIKTVRDDLIAIDNKLELSGQGTYKVAKASAEARDSVISDLDKKLENYNQKLFNFDVVAQRADTIIPSSLTEKLDDIRNQMIRIQELKDTIGDKSKFLNEEDLQNSKDELNNIYLYIDKIFTTISKNNAYKEVRTTAIEKLDLKMAEWLKTNTISSEFRNTIIKLREDLKNVSSDADIKQISEDFMIAERKAKDAGKEGKNFFDLMITKSKHLSAQFLGQYFSLMDIIRYFKTGIETIKELDSALVEMRKVSDESVKSLKNFQKTSFDLGNSVGVTAVQIQNSTADWMRVGDSLAEAQKHAIDANTLMQVSEYDNIEDATNALVSMSQAWEDIDTAHINDVINILGNNMPIATDELASSLQRSAGTLATLGTTIEEAAALTVAGNAILQDPESVAAGLRTIELRMVGTKSAKDELIQMGEDVDDFVVQSESKLRESIMNLTKVASNGYKGFDILDANGNYKSFYERMLGLSEIYEELQKQDKALGTNNATALIELIAGKNRSAIAGAILSSPDLLKESYDLAMNAEGSSAEELEKALDTIEAKIQKLKNQGQEFWATFINSDALKVGIDALTTLLGLVTDLVDNLGSLGTIGLGAAGILGAKGLGLTNYVTYHSLRVPFYKIA